MATNSLRSGGGGQQGFILITVAMVGLLSTLLMAGILSHSVVLEERAVDQRLAEIRAYWVEMGHIRYGFSRIRQHHMCPDGDGTCDPGDNPQNDEMAVVLRSYFNEITAYRHMTYPGEPATYWIDIGMTALDDPANTHSHSMHLIARSSFPNTQSTHPALQGLVQRVRPLELRFCVHLSAWANPCGGFASNNFGGSLNGFYRIKRFAPL